jgi:hypothetical protein
MRIKTFKVFESDIHGLTPEQKSWLDKCTYGTWTVNAEGLVDVEGSFGCYYQGLSDLKGVTFGKVSANFNCSFNKLTSLEGAPGVVSGGFWCSGNRLTSLEGAPGEVRGDFSCSENKLTSLVGAPREVKGDFSCYENKLTSLEGAPPEVGGYFYCYENNLTSLEGAPAVVSRDFYCSGNKLTSLVGAPREVKGDFRCHRNKLTSLEGAPEEVKEHFECENNPLQTLVGAPRKIGGDFRFSAGIGAQQFYIPKGQWGPEGWLQALKTIDDPKAKALVLTLLDPKPLLAKLKGDLKQDGPVLLDLSYFWGVPGAESIQKELEASLTPMQLKSIQALRRMHGYL